MKRLERLEKVSERQNRLMNNKELHQWDKLLEWYQVSIGGIRNSEGIMCAPIN